MTEPIADKAAAHKPGSAAGPTSIETEPSEERMVSDSQRIADLAANRTDSESIADLTVNRTDSESIANLAVNRTDSESIADRAANRTDSESIADLAVKLRDSESIADRAARVLEELAEAGSLRPGGVIVVGVSTSEVRGRHIGTAGAETVAAQLYDGVSRASQGLGLHAVWQCCEHLNRALACERALAEARGWTIVSAVPVPKAGGSMAAYAYRQLQDPCLVEHVQAQAGIDIGETMIGMHVRAVAVPFRPSVRWIGEARVNAAYSRPKLIGGARAVYELPADSSERCD